MKAFLITAVATLPLLSGSAFAQGKGGSAFTNAPNALPWFFPHAGRSRQQAYAARPFGHSEATPEPQDMTTAAMRPPLKAHPPFTIGGLDVRVWAPVEPPYSDEAIGDHLAGMGIWGKSDAN